jgi:membrane associated rhomboid family serine protease
VTGANRRPPRKRLHREGFGPPLLFAACLWSTGKAFICRTNGSIVNQSREPVFNVPSSVVAILVVLALIHATRVVLLTQEQDLYFLLLFSFIPARYDASVLPAGLLPGGWAADIWTFVTYALIHADLMHLGFNVVWLLPFGSALARRFGALRFLTFLAVTAAAGATAHLITHSGQFLPMIGASASISAAMAAAMRFAFQRGGPLATWRSQESRHVPAAPLGAALRDPRVLTFLGVWFGLNMLFGLGSLSLTAVTDAGRFRLHGDQFSQLPVSRIIVVVVVEHGRKLV